MEGRAELSAGLRWRLAFARVGAYTLVITPLLIIGEMMRLALRAHSLAVDAANSYVPAAQELLHGGSPYHPADIARGFAFASPPVAGYVFAPFTTLPRTVEEVAMAVLMLGAALAALFVIGVRDWRCYAAASISPPFVGEFQTANLSALVALLAALVWRYRDNSVMSGGAAGVAIALKLFAWPLVVFLIVTRRFRAATWSVALAVGAIVIPWAGIGFAGAGSYPHLLGLLTRAERGEVYSVGHLVESVFSWRVAELVTYAAGGALLVTAYRARGSARQAFVACLAATLVFTPIVWMHYFVVLPLAIALATTRFGPLWLLPMAFWLSAREGPRHTWQIALVLAVEAAALIVSFMRAADARAVSADRAAHVSQTAWSG